MVQTEKAGDGFDDRGKTEAFSGYLYDGRQGEDRHDRYYRFYYDGRIDNPYRIVYEHSNLEKDFSIHIFY